MTRRHLTPKEMEAVIGGYLRTYRIHRNIDQVTLSARAGISVRALRNLEAGKHLLPAADYLLIRQHRRVHRETFGVRTAQWSISR